MECCQFRPMKRKMSYFWQCSLLQVDWQVVGKDGRAFYHDSLTMIVASHIFSMDWPFTSYHITCTMQNLNILEHLNKIWNVLVILKLRDIKMLLIYCCHNNVHIISTIIQKVHTTIIISDQSKGYNCLLRLK